jgi:hypothetical protein
VKELRWILMAKKKLSDALDSIIGDMFSSDPVDNIQKDTLPIISLPKDALSKEILPKETISKESLPKLTLLKSSFHKDPLPKISLAKRGNYTMVDNDIFKFVMPLIDPGAFVVYLYIYRKIYGDSFSTTSECSVSFEEIKSDLNISHVTATKHMKTLIDKQLITITQEKNAKRARTYALFLPSQIDGFLPKETLPNNSLPKDTLTLTENIFRNDTEKPLPKKTLSMPSEQAFPQADHAPKDNNKDIYKDNDDVVIDLKNKLYLMGFKLSQKQIKEMLGVMSPDQILTRARHTLAKDKKEKLNNKTGYLYESIVEQWEIEDRTKDMTNRLKAMVTLIKGYYDNYLLVPETLGIEYPGLSALEAAAEKCRTEFGEENLQEAIEYVREILADK